MTYRELIDHLTFETKPENWDKPVQVLIRGILYNLEIVEEHNEYTETGEVIEGSRRTFFVSDF